MRTEARRDGDEYVLDGSKRFITQRRRRRRSTSCFAKTDPGGGPRGHLAPSSSRPDTPGLRGRADRAEDGDQGLDDRRALLRRLPGARPRTGSARRATASGSRCGSSTARGPGSPRRRSGSPQGATDYALEYARTRETMGEPIAEHQLVAAMLADMETKCEAARGLLYALRPDDRRRASTGRELTQALGDDEALLHRRRDGGHDRRRAGARRLRLHAGVPGRADDARREGDPDLRGHEPDPASRDRPRDAARAARRLARAGDERPRPARAPDRVLFPDDGITKGDLFATTPRSPPRSCRTCATGRSR